MSAIAAEPIAAARLDLLPLRAEHAAEMAAVLADPALHEFTGGTPASPEALRSRYERLVAGPGRVVVQLGDPAPRPRVPDGHPPTLAKLRGTTTSLICVSIPVPPE
jgi:hypothetical protein